MCCSPRRICGMSSRDRGSSRIEPMSTLSSDICGLITLRMKFGEAKFPEDDLADSYRVGHPKLEFSYGIDFPGHTLQDGVNSQKPESSRRNFKANPLIRKAFSAFRSGTICSMRSVDRLVERGAGAAARAGQPG